jgi:Holliday junction resolvase RusA-like endonuclease
MPRTVVFSGYMTAEGRALKEDFQWQAKTQWAAKPLTGEIAVTVNFYFGSARKRDLDNQNKLILDALSGITYEDNSQINDLHLIRRIDRKNPPH